MAKNYELLCVLASKGFTDPIMKAARAKGAMGGTIITARGNADANAQKNYGIIITPDKDLIIMLIDKEIKDKVAKAIFDVAGIETQGMAIIWSMPADNVVGGKIGEEELKNFKKTLTKNKK